MAEGIPLQISFYVIRDAGKPELFTLKGEGSSIRIGRDKQSDIRILNGAVSTNHCQIILARKSRDEGELRVVDSSANATGVRHPRAALGKPWTQLHKAEQGLQHLSRLLIPHTTKKEVTKQQQVELVILLCLPDMYCHWNKQGRWDYKEKLGEGGLAAVYRAVDMQKGLGEVAVKVSKFYRMPSACQQNRHIYALHREARWSLERLHNPADPRHEQRGASFFVRYLEDHTGLAQHGPANFSGFMRKFEDPTFSWLNHHFEPPLWAQPYVVMELVNGKLLQAIVDGQPPLTIVEKRRTIRQAVEALVYLERFGAIHRDYRGCNMFLVGRGDMCRIRVIDLGFMIETSPVQASNPNIAVRCAWQGDANKKVRFDWAPPEVRVKGGVNYAEPGCSFDVFSLGVLILKLLKGRGWTQDALSDPTAIPFDDAELREQLAGIQLPWNMLKGMLDHEKPENRPLPEELLQALGGPLPDVAVGSGTPQTPLTPLSPCSLLPPPPAPAWVPPPPPMEMQEEEPAPEPAPYQSVFTPALLPAPVAVIAPPEVEEDGEVVNAAIFSPADEGWPAAEPKSPPPPPPPPCQPPIPQQGAAPLDRAVGSMAPTTPPTPQEAALATPMTPIPAAATRPARMPPPPPPPPQRGAALPEERESSGKRRPEWKQWSSWSWWDSTNKWDGDSRWHQSRREARSRSRSKRRR